MVVTTWPRRRRAVASRECPEMQIISNPSCRQRPSLSYTFRGNSITIDAGLDQIGAVMRGTTFGEVLEAGPGSKFKVGDIVEGAFGEHRPTWVNRMLG